MKKLLALALALIMILSLSACGGKMGQEAPAPSGKENSVPENPEPEKSGDPIADILAAVGLDYAAIEPDEGYYRFGESDGEITVYLEKETEKNVAVFLKKVMEACRAASDDGITYDANMDFFMNSADKKALELPSDDEINGYGFYLAQFGYYLGGKTITVTFASLDDTDPERNDDINYPVYTLSFIK